MPFWFHFIEKITKNSIYQLRLVYENTCERGRQVIYQLYVLSKRVLKGKTAHLVTWIGPCALETRSRSTPSFLLHKTLPGNVSPFSFYRSTHKMFLLSPY